MTTKTRECETCKGNGEVEAGRDGFGNYETKMCLVCSGTGVEQVKTFVVSMHRHGAQTFVLVDAGDVEQAAELAPLEAAGTDWTADVEDGIFEAECAYRSRYCTDENFTLDADNDVICGGCRPHVEEE